MESDPASGAIEVCSRCTLNSNINRCSIAILNRCYDENEDLFAEALAKDLRKPRQEAVMFEVTISNHCSENENNS